MEIGHKLKGIKLIINDKSVLTEKDLLGKKVIIYFYPKDDTPGCTTEAIDFTSFKNEFDKLDVNVLAFLRTVLRSTLSLSKSTILKLN